MKLRTINGYALSSPIDPPQERPFHGGVRRLLKRDVVLVAVETADGQQGFATAGASSSAMREFFSGDSQGTFADVLEGTIADALEGTTIDQVTDVHKEIRTTDLPGHLQQEAISAIDVALYDIRGKRAGAPIYEVLTEKFESTPTTELPLYASGGMYMDPEGYAQQAQAIEDCGFMGYKYRPGIGPDGDRKTIDCLAEATEEMEIMLDSHTWWKLEDAYGEDIVYDLVQHAADSGAYWVEEPVEPDDYDGYSKLAKTGASLAGGESEPNSAGLIELAATDAISFLQGDVRHHEGYTGCRKAIEYCQGRDTEFVPHNFGSWLGLIANAHLVAAAPEVRLLEYPVFEQDPVLEAEDDPGMYPFDLAFDIIKGKPDIDNGHLSVPDGPGLGVEINLDVIEEYPFIDGPWTEFHYEK